MTQKNNILYINHPNSAKQIQLNVNMEYNYI